MKFIQKIKETTFYKRLKVVLSCRDDQNKISIIERILFFPFWFFWWLIQLIFFTILFGMVSIISGVTAILNGWFFGKTDQISFGIFLILLPLISPVVWWYKYIIYGQYCTVINLIEGEKT